MGVARLIALGGQLRARLFERRFSRLQRRGAPVQLRAADEAFVAQSGKALQIRGGQIALGLRGGRLGARRIGGKLVVARIQPGQKLAFFHMLAWLHGAFDDLARHAKTQARFHFGPHFARIFGLAGSRGGGHGHQLDSAHRRGRGGMLAAGGQRQGGGQGGGGGKAVALHGGAP